MVVGKFVNPMEEGASSDDEEVETADTAGDEGLVEGVMMFEGDTGPPQKARGRPSLTVGEQMNVKMFRQGSEFGTVREGGEGYTGAEEEEMVEQQKQRCGGLLYPPSRISTIYDSVQAAMLVYILVMIPWRIAFQIKTTASDPIFWVDIFVDLCIVFDIGLSFRRYYFDSQTNQLVTDAARIRNRYLASWFLIDLLSVIPFEMIADAMSEGDTSATGPEESKLIRLLRLARFARLAKLSNLRKSFKTANDALRDIGISNQGMELVGRVVVLTLLVFMVTHVGGCLWIYAIQATIAKGEINNWYVVEFQSHLVNTTELHRAIALPNGPQPQKSVVYVAATYFFMITMGAVGYGDLIAYSTDERVDTCILIILSVFMWAYICGQFTTTISAMDGDKTKFDEHIRRVMTYLRWREAPPDLMDRIDAFYHYKFESKTLFDEQEVLAMIPPRLRHEFYLHRYKTVINAIPLFRGCFEDAIVAVVMRMSSFSLSPMEYLFHAGGRNIDLIVLTKGVAASVLELPDGHDTMEAQYRAGDYFGEDQFLGLKRFQEETVRARTFCEVSTLNPHRLQSVLDTFPPLKRSYEKYRALRHKMTQKLHKTGWGEHLGSGHSEGEWMAELHELKAGIDSETLASQQAVTYEFAKLDQDKNGRVDCEGVRACCAALGKPLKQWQLEEAMTAMGTDISGWVDLDAFAHWWDMSHTEEAVNHNVRARMTRADDVALAERTRMEHCIKDEQQFQDHLGQLESQLATVRQVFRGRMAALKEDFSAVR